jgi:hypothetical protein
VTRKSLLAAALLVSACSGMSDDTKEAVENVVTLQTGAVSDLRKCRGMGPFRDYEVPPEEMLYVIEGVLLGKTPAVWVNLDALEVVAKERVGGLAASDEYDEDWLSAVSVMVHPVVGHPGRSRVEVHSVQKGKFKKGWIAWEREIPPLLDAAVAGHARGLRPIK